MDWVILADLDGVKVDPLEKQSEGPSVRCIWCTTESKELAEEHIVPEALGLIPELVFRAGEVCKDCNNRLAHLDRAVTDEFEICRFLAGVPRKRGKPPVIDSRSNIVGRYGDGEPTIAVNMENHSVEALGKRLGSAKGNPRNVESTFVDLGNGNAQIKIRHPIGNSPEFCRGLHKIAFSFMAFLGHQEDAVQTRYDFMRDYVVRGVGSRRVIIIETETKGYQVQPVLYGNGDEGYPSVFVLRLASADFVIDLSINQRYLGELMLQLRKSQGEKGWTWVPIEP